MKISELIKLHGLPVKITRRSIVGDWYEILADARKDMYPAYTNNDNYTWCNKNNDDDWELYVEAKPKKKFDAYVVMVDGVWSIQFCDSGYLPKLPQKHHLTTMPYVRVPQFDCEVDA